MAPPARVTHLSRDSVVPRNTIKTRWEIDSHDGSGAATGPASSRDLQIADIHGGLSIVVTEPIAVIPAALDEWLFSASISAVGDAYSSTEQQPLLMRNNWLEVGPGPDPLTIGRNAGVDVEASKAAQQRLDAAHDGDGSVQLLFGVVHQAKTAPALISQKINSLPRLLSGVAATSLSAEYLPVGEGLVPSSLSRPSVV